LYWAVQCSCTGQFSVVVLGSSV